MSWRMDGKAFLCSWRGELERGELENGWEVFFV